MSITQHSTTDFCSEATVVKMNGRKYGIQQQPKQEARALEGCPGFEHFEQSTTRFSVDYS